MDYHSFEDDIHAVVLERGQAYFVAGAVSQLKDTVNGWSALVKGTEEYNVTLSGTDGLDDWICTCPHDHGPVCKHVAAVLYAIKQKINEEFGATVNTMSEAELRKVILGELMRSRSFSSVIASLKEIS